MNIKESPREYGISHTPRQHEENDGLRARKRSRRKRQCSQSLLKQAKYIYIYTFERINTFTGIYIYLHARIVTTRTSVRDDRDFVTAM